MLKDHEKLIICITPAGVVLGIDDSGRLQPSYERKPEGHYRVGNPVNLLVKIERTGSSIQLSSFVFPSSYLDITFPAITVAESDMESRFRDNLRKQYDAFTVQATSGLILAKS